MSETLPKPMFPTFAAAWRQLPSLLRRLRYTRLRDLVRGRLDGSLDWRARLSESELPPEITGVVQQVAGRHRLWHRERRDIATELIAHFQDGLDAGESAESLVASFGDAKQAAKLMLRAKRRCRPIWWQAWWWASRGFAVLLALYALLAIWLSGVKPQIGTDYVAVLNEPLKAIPEQDRAWPLYFDALKTVYEESRGQPDTSSRNPVWTPWPFEDSPRPGSQPSAKVLAWVASHQAFLAKIREAAAKPALGVELGNDAQYLHDYAILEDVDPNVSDGSEAGDAEDAMYSILLPHIQDLRNLGRVLYVDAIQAAKDGDATTALADIEAMLGVARHASEGAFIVSGLVKIAVNGRAIDAVREILAEHPGLWSDTQLDDLARLFAAIRYDFPAWIKAERLAFLDIVQRVYSDDGEGDGFLTATGYAYAQDKLLPLVELTENTELNGLDSRHADWLASASSPVLWTVAASRRELVEKYDELMDLATADSKTPLWKWPDANGVFETKLLELETEQPLRFNLINLLMPAYSATIQAIELANGRRDGVLVGIALEQCRRETVGWPDSLDELIPEWLPSLPVDRVNSGPLGYQIVDGKPVIYSLGIDADDDQGRLSRGYRDMPWRQRIGPPAPNLGGAAGSHPHDGDWVIWSLAEPRYVPAKDNQQQPAE